jgi:hypothetical protein
MLAPVIATRLEDEISRLHELTGFSRDGEAVQRNYDNRKELELYAKLDNLRASAERHAQRAQAAKRRAGELDRERDAAWRRALVAGR